MTRLRVRNHILPVNKKIKPAFSPPRTVFPGQRVVNRAAHECLVKIALLRGLFEPCVVPRRLISTQFDRLRECGPRGVVSPVAEPLLPFGSGRLKQIEPGRQKAQWALDRQRNNRPLYSHWREGLSDRNWPASAHHLMGQQGVQRTVILELWKQAAGLSPAWRLRTSPLWPISRFLRRRVYGTRQASPQGAKRQVRQNAPSPSDRRGSPGGSG
jgi:hypothetical protein